MKKVFSFENSYGDVLKGHVWECENFKKIVIIVTGMQEHSNRYDYLATILNKNSYQVYCLNHYGQGNNVTNNDYGIVVKDFFDKMADTIFELYCDLYNKYEKEIYIISHSMGSFISQNMIQRHKSSTKKLILIGTSGKMRLASIGYMLAKLIVNKRNFNKPAKLLKSLTIGKYSNSIKNKEYDADWISYNKENVIKYINDEACNYECSNGFYLYLIKGLATIHKNKNIKKVDKNLDIYVLVGEDDPVSNNSKTCKHLIKQYKKLGHDKIDLKIYKNARHEILNEDIKDQVTQDILKFLEK